MKEKITDLLKNFAPENEFAVETPSEKKLGDYSTNLAFILAKKKKKPPLKIAQKIVSELPKADFLKKIEAAPPGFINFYLNERWLVKAVGEILKKGEDYGRLELGKGKKIQIEFISANPTGPLTLGNGRGGFLGKVLTSVLEFAGFKVEREYYINDTGNQIEALGHSVLKDKLAVYRGDYIAQIAKKIKKGSPKETGRRAAQIILSDIIKKTIAKMGIKFDRFVSEEFLIKSGQVEKAIEQLKKKGLVYQKEGAVWFKATKFGDDKDRVLVKQDGEYTYFASDIAYHLNKTARGFDLLIDIWGADHHGDIPRLKAVAKVFGFDEKLKIILHQFVRLLSKSEVVRMSKRKGTYYAMGELIDAVGLDAVSYFFLTKAPETHLDFDLELAKEKSEKNPVYYIQYASARIHGILAKLKTKNEKVKTTTKNLKLLTQPAELDLIKQLIKFPDLIEEIVRTYQVQKLPQYALELATSFHNFYEKCRVLEAGAPDLAASRVALVSATQIVLKNVLNLMGIKAPERM